MRSTAHRLALSWLACLALCRPCAAAPGNGTANTAANSVARAIVETGTDIRNASQELNSWRTDTAVLRAPLASSVQKLQDEVRRLRAETQRRRRARLQGEAERLALAARVEQLQQECGFIDTLVSEYRRSLETRAGQAESHMLAGRLQSIDLALASDDEFGGLDRAVDELLDLADSWNRQRLGGLLFEGQAVDKAGIRHDGRFAVLGPVAYFAASRGEPAGPTTMRPDSAAPSVYTGFKDQAVAGRVADVTRGEQRRLPVDVTLGDAMRVALSREGIGGHLRKGGFVMVPLLAVGAVALALTLLKAIALARIRTGRDDVLADAIEAAVDGQPEEARTVAARAGQPLGPILAYGIQHADSPAEHLEEILGEKVAAAVPHLERHMQTLAVLGAVAPLLGLLGTVTGMIHTFQMVTVFGSGDAKLLSGGISEALITTEVGLVIAVPVLLVHAFLARRVRVIIGDMERCAAEFVHQLAVRRGNRGPDNRTA